MEAITSPPMVQSSAASARGSILHPLIISMLGIVVTAIAIVAYHLFLVKFCIRRTTTTAAQPHPNAAEPPAGVDEKVLQTIPIFTFSAVKHGDMDYQDECVVCLGELEDDDTIRLLPNCKHAFHVQCIDQWFAAHASCPLCRSPIIILEQTNAGESSPDRSGDSDRESSSEYYSAAAANSSCESSPRAQSSTTSSRFGLLRHCVSLQVVVPPPSESRTSPSSPRLKRSMSMDQSFVVINLAIAASSSSSSTSTLTRSSSFSARSLSQFRASSKWLRSFSRLRLGKGSSNATLLPY